MKTHLLFYGSSILFFIGVFSCKPKQSASSSKTEIAYIDGNNNRFELISNKNVCEIEYKPIQPDESSSGTYSGGEPVSKTIACVKFDEIQNYMKKIVANPSNLIQERNMGCGTILLNPTSAQFIPMNSRYKDTLERKLRALVYLKEHNVITISGRLEERYFESKKGVVTKQKELFFIPDESAVSNYQLQEEYFVKLSQCKVSKDELVANANKTVKLQLVCYKGLWDTDNNTYQSRFGHYVAIEKIIKD